MHHTIIQLQNQAIHSLLQSKFNESTSLARLDKRKAAKKIVEESVLIRNITKL